MQGRDTARSRFLSKKAQPLFPTPSDFGFPAGLGAAREAAPSQWETQGRAVGLHRVKGRIEDAEGSREQPGGACRGRGDSSRRQAGVRPLWPSTPSTSEQWPRGSEKGGPGGAQKGRPQLKNVEMEPRTLRGEGHGWKTRTKGLRVGHERTSELTLSGCH